MFFGCFAVFLKRLGAARATEAAALRVEHLAPLLLVVQQVLDLGALLLLRRPCLGSALPQAYQDKF